MRMYGLTAEQVEELWAGLGDGESLSRIARRVGVPMQHVRRFFAQTGGVRPHPAGRSARHLAAFEREEISRGVAVGLSLRCLARRLGRSHTTVAREVARNGGRQEYRAAVADEAAFARGRRPKPSKLAGYPRLQAVVREWLELDWSPQQISRHLAVRFPNEAGMRVSHETIYLSVFQPARKALTRGLHRHLRTARTMRYPIVSRRPTGRGRIRGMVSIHDRPLR